jgi:hydrogenase expression/formation protein HypC
MCLAVPARVQSITGNTAEVELGGVLYRADIRLTPGVKVGDYVLLHTGYAIGIIDQAEAEQTRKLFMEIEAADEIP